MTRRLLSRVHACHFCGDRFTPYRSWQRFCRPEHRWRWHNDRRKPPDTTVVYLSEQSRRRIAQEMRRHVGWPEEIARKELLQIRGGPEIWKSQWTTALLPYLSDQQARRLTRAIYGVPFSLGSWLAESE